MNKSQDELIKERDEAVRALAAMRDALRNLKHSEVDYLLGISTGEFEAMCVAYQVRTMNVGKRQAFDQVLELLNHHVMVQGIVTQVKALREKVADV